MVLELRDHRLYLIPKIPFILQIEKKTQKVTNKQKTKPLSFRTTKSGIQVTTFCCTNTFTRWQEIGKGFISKADRTGR